MITVDEKGLVREWRTGGYETFEILLATELPLEEATAVLGAATGQVMGQSEDVGLSRPARTPRGPVLFVDYCDSEDDLRRALSRLKDALEAHGVEGKLRPFRTQHSPLDDPLAKFDNLTAALSLRGEPTSDAEREASFANVEWRTDPDAQRLVVDHALEWCQVPGGQHFVSAGMTQFKIDPDQRRDLLGPSIGASPYAALICTNGREEYRRVEFDRHGRALFQHGGTQVPTGWPDLVAEMTTILTELPLRPTMGSSGASTNSSSSGRNCSNGTGPSSPTSNPPATCTRGASKQRMCQTRSASRSSAPGTPTACPPDPTGPSLRRPGRATSSPTLTLTPGTPTQSRISTSSNAPAATSPHSSSPTTSPRPKGSAE